MKLPKILGKRHPATTMILAAAMLLLAIFKGFNLQLDQVSKTILLCFAMLGLVILAAAFTLLVGKGLIWLGRRFYQHLQSKD